MELMIERYENNGFYASYAWNKYNVYVVKVLRVDDNGVQTGPLIFYKVYPTEKQAKKSFQRQVRKLKKQNKPA